jgi:hypothetical protein
MCSKQTLVVERYVYIHISFIPVMHNPETCATQISSKVSPKSLPKTQGGAHHRVKTISNWFSILARSSRFEEVLDITVNARAPMPVLRCGGEFVAIFPRRLGIVPFVVGRMGLDPMTSCA